ncbi:tripartite tricarboxylate transporter TctB family protein [Bacillus sp. Marseille-P3661]|uniref:tripartite tricarboxylate transporter TctB family protein n=1 Tax=Bacillus sp. Marseille-P3661 TaxID=1936234 RepID=UPI000C865294
MEGKYVSYTTMIFLIFIGVFYYIGADQFSLERDSSTLGPDYFPKLLSILLVIFCVINLFKIRKESKSKFELNNLKMIVLTIATICLYITSWSLLGLFYINTFLFLLLLLSLYQFKQKVKYKYLKNAVISLSFTLFIYLLFDLILALNL